MKKLLLVVVAVTLLASSAGAQAKKRRVADKKFWIATVVIVAASALDIESTQRALKRCPSCTEANSLLFGKRPTRGRMYGVLMPITALEIWGMWWVKKDDDKNGTKAWLVVPILHIGAHGGAAWYNYVKDTPRTCPAQGAGCASP